MGSRNLYFWGGGILATRLKAKTKRMELQYEQKGRKTGCVSFELSEMAQFYQGILVRRRKKKNKRGNSAILGERLAPVREGKKRKEGTQQSERNDKFSLRSGHSPGNEQIKQKGGRI